MTRMGERRSKLQTAASVLLIVLMVLGTVGVIGALFGDLKKAEAATAGSYYIKISADIQFTSSWRCSKLNNTFSASWGNTTNDSAGCVIRYKSNNGTGTQSDQTVDLHNWCTNTNETSWTSKTIGVTVSGFPTGFYFCLDQNDSGIGGGTTKIHVHKIEVGPSSSNLTTIWDGTLAHESTNQTKKTYIYQDGTHDASGGSVSETSGGWNMPYANSISAISGDDSINVNTDGSTANTKSYSLGTVKDQYSVNWYQDASWDTATVSNGVSFSSGTLTVPASSNRANDYTVTLKEKCGSATNTKTVTIKTFDYKVTFYDENGTTVLKNEQTVDYGGSASPPADPTKAYDASKHYAFDQWTGDGYSNITTGAQTKTVKASYLGTVHDAFLTWDITDSTHKQYCSVCGYVKVAQASHSFGDWTVDTATCEAGGSHSHTCSVCNHTVTENTPALGHDWNYSAATYAWSSDHSTCTATVPCRRNANHTTTVNGSVTSQTTAATCAAAGETVYTATFAQSGLTTQTASVELPIDPANHTNLTHTAAVAATCTTSGHTEYWYCSGCQKYFNNSTGTTEITQASTVIDALDHDWDYAHVAAGDYTWTGTTACSATVHCSRDNTHTTTVTANSITDEVTTAATCTSTGVRTYTAHFAESNAMSSTTTETIPVNPANHTHLTHTAAVAATCTTAGNTEYWYCSGCQKYFSNAAGTTEITQAATVINALDHNWDYAHAAYSWTGYTACTATITCLNDSSHTTTENATITSEVTTAATCAATGVKTFTATFATAGLTTQTTTETLAVNPTNHTNLQHFAAAAATCTADGNIEYWYCAGCGKYFSDAAGTAEITQAQTVDPRTGHRWGAWTYLNENQHQRVCANDASHTEQENHSYGDWINQNNGTKICTCAGCGHQKTMYIGYSVTFNGNGATSGSMGPQGFTYGTAQTLTPNAFGRAYAVTYVYNNGSANGSDTATASFGGWATAADGAKVYDDEESVNNLTTVENGEVPLYAVWTLGSVTLPTPTKAGYAFAGWYLEDTFESQVAGDTFIPTANTTLYAKWTQVALNDTFILSSNRATKLNVLGNDIPGATLTTVTEGTGFTTSKDEGKVVFTPTAQLNSAVTFTYTASYGGTTGTATVTVVPASNVYYEESGFITFADGSGTAKWADAGTEYSGVFEEGMRPGEAGSPMSAYESTSETTYSMGNAKYVTVKKGDTGATATFTFTGTGFDFYAATTNKAGLALVDIYKVENGTETDLESTLINTYFGYEYGPLYLDANNTVTLEEEGNAPIWYTDDTGAGTFFINGTRRGTTAETAGAEQAYGWVATKAEGEDGLYQVPVISYTDLDYGTYKVVIEPRYSARQDLTGDGQYKFYVDAVRVYDPVDPDNITTGTAVYDAYALDRELNATYQSVRDLLIDPNNGGAATDGVAFLDLGAASESIDLAKYADVGPKNEVYLNPGQAIAFNMETASAAQPAKLCIGLKMVRGESGTVQIASAGTQTVTVTGATDIYHEITGAVAWAPTGKDGAYKTTSAIIVTNTSGEGKAISITKLKWSYGTATVAGANTMSFSFAPQDLVTAKAVAQSIRLPQPTADAAGVVLRWSKASYNEGETATLTITAPARFVKAFVDGAELTDYTETADGLRQWTYTFIARSSGTFGYDVTLEDGATARRTGTLPTSVTVAAGQSDANTNTNNGRRMLTLRALLQKLAERLMQVFKLSFVKGTVK